MSVDSKEPSKAQIVKRHLTKLLRAHGYASELGYFTKYHNDINKAVLIVFLPSKGKSDFSRLNIQLSAWSERVADVIGRKTELTWRSPQVWASLARMGPNTNDEGCWSFRKDDSQQVEFVVSQIESALIDFGFPFLDAIREDDDVMRIMRDTNFVHYHRDLVNQFVEKYHSVNPEFSLERSS